MDLIAGLPGDDYEGFVKSIDKAISLGAENITVHTLALKRSSTIVTENESDSVNSQSIAKMLEYAKTVLTENGYLTSPKDFKLIKDPQFKRQYIDGIVCGVVNYFLEQGVK